MDNQQKVIIEPKYEMLNFFKDGYNVFQRDDLFGLLDQTGKEVVPAQYPYITENNTSQFIVVDQDIYSLYTIQNNRKVASNLNTIQFTDDPSILLVSKHDKYGFINDKGKVIIHFKYTYASPFIDGVSIVAEDEDMEDMYYINTQGERIAQ